MENEKDRKRRRGLTDEQYNGMLVEQGFRCAICLVEFAGKKKPCVDHDNETRMVRGILCNQCNSILGYFKDNPEILRSKGHREHAWYVERCMARKGDLKVCASGTPGNTGRKRA